MKKMMIYDLWVMLISYSFLLNGNCILGILLEVLILLYNLAFVKRINYWRFLSCLLISSLFSFVLVLYSDINIGKLIFPFLLLVCFNSSIVNEIAYKIKVFYLMPIYMMLSISFLIFALIAIIIPDTPLLPAYKANLYTYISLIFVPSFMNMSICILSKMFKKKKYKANYVLK